MTRVMVVISGLRLRLVAATYQHGGGPGTP